MASMIEQIRDAVKKNQNDLNNIPYSSLISALNVALQEHKRMQKVIDKLPFMPYGFDSWVDTYTVVTDFIKCHDEGEIAQARKQPNDIEALRKLAYRWTTEYESKNRKKQFNYDAIEAFCYRKLKGQEK